MPHFLIIESRYYEAFAADLLAGASAALEAAGASYETIEVPGVLEIPAALSMILSSDSAQTYDGYVVLGCVIRGETTHYEIVANESARVLMLMAAEEALALGNGILTVENAEQARVRASKSEKDKGGDAARAALAMVRLKERLDA